MGYVISSPWVDLNLILTKFKLNLYSESLSHLQLGVKTLKKVLVSTTFGLSWLKLFGLEESQSQQLQKVSVLTTKAIVILRKLQNRQLSNFKPMLLNCI